MFCPWVMRLDVWDTAIEPLFHAAAPQLILVTGERGSGKSTWCTRLVAHARLKHLTTQGVLSPAVFDGENKVGIDLIDLHSDERRRLAVLRQAGASGIVTPRWHFDAAVLAWSDQILNCVSADRDLLVIDELGPLEFDRGEGWQSGLAALDSGRYRVAFVVVRPELIPQAHARWPYSQVLRDFD
jgi:nucleoside-triphosphatase